MRKLFFVIGPSGSGKTTLVDYSLEKLGKKYNLERIPSVITRPPRDGEVDGENFFFVDCSWFNYYIRNNDFIEWEAYANLRHGLLKNVAFYEKDRNFIKEITVGGLEKVIEYAKENGFEEDIVVIKIIIDQQELRQRLVARGMSEEEIYLRAKADSVIKNSKVKIDKCIFNDITIGPKKEFSNFVEGHLKQVRQGCFEAKKLNTKEKVMKMIKIRSGYTVINQPSNADERFVHITVESENEAGVVYYVTADRLTGKLIGCSCPRGAMFPYEKCKHQRAVINQRLLGK